MNTAVMLGRCAVLVGDKIYLFLPPAGYNDVLPVLDYVTCTWNLVQTSAGPFPRHAHTTTLVSDLVLLLGGIQYVEREAEELINIFDLSTHDWLKLKSYGDVPELRRKHLVEYFERRNQLALFAHADEHLLSFDNVFLLDVSTSTWKRQKTKGTLPSPRALATTQCAYDKLFLFAGNNGALTSYNDLNVLDFVGKHRVPTWSSLPNKGTPPPGVIGSSLTLFDNKLFVVGGFSYLEAINGFFCYDLATNEWLKDEIRDSESGEVIPATGNMPGRNYGVVAMASTDNIIVFGGVQNAGGEVYVLER